MSNEGCPILGLRHSGDFNLINEDIIMDAICIATESYPHAIDVIAGLQLDGSSHVIIPLAIHEITPAGKTFHFCPVLNVVDHVIYTKLFIEFHTVAIEGEGDFDLGI
mmetsp:Transcript_43989/g.78956  ORF Transcript_43989/g.78956 Transcript_43989/m.78956 type:complete len:107 (-) Transcript_43989:1557-1877(-)